MRSFVAWLAVAMAIGCGSITKQNSGDKNPGSQPAPTTTGTGTSTATGSGVTAAGAPTIFATEADLPSCDDSREGSLVYVSETRSFRACADGEWSVIDLKGEKGETGEKGDPGTAGDTTAAIQLYKTYRKSVYRVTLQCTRTSPVPAACQDRPPTATLLGSAFLCSDTEVCTNQHVAECPECFSMTRLDLQAIEGTTDSINGDGSPAAPFHSATSNTGFKLHSTYDLAKIPIDAAPEGAVPLPLSAEPVDQSIQTLDPILSLSFALGFQDLYVDVGYVNTKHIGECDREGGTSGYGCPSKSYDFSTSNDTDHGSSGSPLIDVNTGKVVGVTSAGTEGENANFTWAIDASRFYDVD